MLREEHVSTTVNRPKYTQDGLYDGKDGRVMASVTHVPDVGHLVSRAFQTLMMSTYNDTLPDGARKSLRCR